MGDRTTISGHIQEAWYAAAEPELQQMEAVNASVIHSLSEADGSPILTREMFTIPERSEGSRVIYRGRAICFGGSYHGLWTEWDAWLNEFESLLRRMYWEHAVVVLVTEYMGTHLYEWKASKDALVGYMASPPLAASGWSFSGGPRDFMQPPS